MNFLLERMHFLALNVGCCEHDGDWNWKDVRSPFSRLYYVTEGEAKLALPSGTYRLRPGYFYFIPAYTQHSCICDSKFTHYYLHLFEDHQQGPSVLEEIDIPVEVECQDDNVVLLFKRLCELNPFLKIPESNPESYDNHQMIVNNYKLLIKRPFHERVETTGIVYQILSHVFKHSPDRESINDDRVSQAIKFIRTNINKPIDIDMLANNACMSKGHFFRVFKNQVGETPNVYITKRKTERAELLLVTTDNSVKAISDELGFEDYSYFIRLFKKQTGLTPQQYREQNFPQEK